MNKINDKQRQPWLDVVRGICSLLVVLYHVPSTPLSYVIFYSPIMIPAFFFVSGYLSKNYDGSVLKFLYNRVLKLFICYLIIMFVGKILIVSNIPLILQNPKYLIQIIISYFVYIYNGYDFWFLPCLICISLYFIIINKICRDKPVPMLIISAIIAGIGLYIGEPDKFILWHSQTAMICLFFYMAGYCVKKTQWIDNHNFTAKSCILTGLLYFSAVIVFSLIFGMENIIIVAANNEWKILPVTAILIFLGIIFIICLSKQLNSCRILAYIGAHSMIYFTFGSRCTDIIWRGINALYSLIKLPFINNTYIMSIFFTVCTCALMLVICKLSDKFFPALNGRINLPELKLKKT